MNTDHTNPRLRRITAEVCENCLNGTVGTCHMPGCLFCRFRIEDTPQPLNCLVSIPRIFNNGDTIPAGVCVMTEFGVVQYFDDTEGCQHDREPGELCGECNYDIVNGNHGPLVEVLLSDYWTEMTR